MQTEVFKYLEAHEQELLAYWQALVNMESGSANVEGITKVARKIKKTVEEAGAKVQLKEFAEAGPTLIADFPGETAAPVLFLGHMDTVFKLGSVAERPFTIKEGKAYGPGVLDMKAGVTIAVFAAKALRAAGCKRPLRLVLAGDEEVGHVHSNAPQIIMEAAKGCVAAFNCETGFVDNSFVTGRKGAANFKLAVTGVSSHAGNDPKRGRSAILEMAHKIIDLQALTDWDRGFSFNVGTVSGGTVFNAIPGYCEAVVDIRYLDPAIVPELKAKVQAVAAKTYVEGTKTEVVGFKVVMDAMKTTEGVKQLFSLLAQTSEELGFGKATSKLVGGGSDSCYTVMAGVPTICAMGVKGQYNHTLEEYALVDTMLERAKLLAAMALRVDALES